MKILQKLQKIAKKLQKIAIFCEILQNSQTFSEKLICKKSGFFSEKFCFFSNSAVSEVCLSERASKMLQNELLDVQKLAELAENESLQTSKIRSSKLTRQGVNAGQNAASEPDGALFPMGYVIFHLASPARS